MNKHTTTKDQQIAAVNALLKATAKILNDDSSRPHRGVFKVGVDTVLPAHPLHLTQLAIAAFFASAAAPQAQAY